ncbi:FAD-dependent monooxygenase [Amycolatopsis suaedae]|uniref:FAD-dependent oxidoreductase n=1 Tax=Amycolatopsis suaedae TaxID=2510978 RepID=A0A4V2EMH5_9PSEU|nr:FAD-dependent monooxygenase [Amycolatopsis suaedae]RZQ65085.1 FAD-dependent oxidoreductase [Amycolatopsis suaedae]
MLSRTSVLISGAGVAGPALAFWLCRYGFDVTVVETAPRPRTGGYAVDFRGEVHLGLLRRMGLLDRLRELRTEPVAPRFVDEHGATKFVLPAEWAAGALEVRRGDLSRLLIEESGAEYVHGDSIRSLHDDGDGVHVEFGHAPARRFDLVAGADGMHSNVRALVFGPESRYRTYLGYQVAGWQLPGDAGRQTLAHSQPGRYAGISGNNAYLLFASERDTDADPKRQLREAFAGMGWLVPSLLATLDDAEDLYFDSISRIDVEPWSRGRVVLVGDAACGATLGGRGTGTALVAAYVLAGELARGEHRVAFERYERMVRGYATRCQEGGAETAAVLAPPTAAALAERDAAFADVSATAERIEDGVDVTEDIDLPDYCAAAVSRSDCQSRK